MKHFTASEKEKIDSIAIGTFDGLHLGHQQLIKKLSPNGALFVIDRAKANLTPGRKRSDYTTFPCFYYKIDQIKSFDCTTFVSFLKAEFPNLKNIIIGYDFKFGAQRSCDIMDLKNLFKGTITIVDEFFLDGISVHSSKVRELIQKGEIRQANHLIGRRYCISGQHIRGQGLGKKEFVPTINLEIGRYILPKHGVYSTVSKIGTSLFPSVTFIGIRESSDGKFSCETHILDSEIEAPESLEVCFVDFIRENKKFDSFEALKIQILKDIDTAKKIITKSGLHG
ncbi:bifunctional riboflavin kinase/FAD synthetase [Sulfurospirillum sp. 1612]|uniref:bifunctional riboflavin kinase/FAD synthetase n=1 Tax=Sulfurospirillum sp. 1612 TaxID=3094835 RepID=UPI002F945B5A